MEKESEDKILEAIGRQRQDMMSELKTIGGQNNVIIDKLEKYDGRFDRLESAVLDNSTNIKEISKKVERTESAVLENSKDIKEIKKNIDIAVTNHESRMRKIEDKASV